VLRIGNFDRSKSRSRRLEGPSRSAFRTIKLGKIRNTNNARMIIRNTNQKLTKVTRWSQSVCHSRNKFKKPRLLTLRLPSLIILSRPPHGDLDLASRVQQSRGAPRQISVTTLYAMRTLGVSASYPSPLTASTAGASLGLGEPLGGLSSSPLTQTPQPQTLGKRSRKQLVPQRDPAAAGHLSAPRVRKSCRRER